MVNCFNFRTIHILIEQATFLLHCFMYTLAFVDQIIIKPKCPRNVTTLGHFKKIYSGHPEITVRRNILHDFLDRLIVK